MESTPRDELRAERAPAVIAPVGLEEVRAAARRIASLARRTPLLPLDSGTSGGTPCEIHLKLECLQPTGSFKLRGAANALASATRAELADGVTTPSAGNMGLGVAWSARRLGLACRVIVPDSAPRAKTDALQALGADVVPVPFDEWWSALAEGAHPLARGLFVHPVAHPAVIAGNGTIGLELAEELAEFDTVVVPFGGGGLAAGIACALAELRPEVRVLAAEVETAAPLTAALAAGRPVAVPHAKSFVDGIGGKSVLPAMWPLVSRVLAGTVVSTLDEVALAVRRLAAGARVVSEGAGAAALAAALAGRAGTGRVVCIVSGGNIDARVLATILSGATPR